MAIIDIQSKSKKVQKLKEGFVHVSYSEDYDAYILAKKQSKLNQIIIKIS
jgi:hypothetical protein